MERKPDRGTDRSGRWDAASGLAALLFGVAGGALERGWPSTTDPLVVGGFITDHRAAVLAQSMCFLASSAFYLWFVAALRSFMRRVEPGPGTLSNVAFGAGVAWVVGSMMAQTCQIAVASAPPSAVTELALTYMGTLFAVANLPCAVMLGAVAALSYRHGGFPTWLAWIAVLAGVAELFLWIGAVVTTGPLAPNGWLAFVLYPSFLVWLVPTVTIMVRRSFSPGAQP